eukprot:gene10646-14298_t
MKRLSLISIACLLHISQNIVAFTVTVPRTSLRNEKLSNPNNIICNEFKLKPIKNSLIASAATIGGSVGRLFAAHPVSVSGALFAAVSILVIWLDKVLWKPSRTYQGSETVAKEYDAWSSEGILEYYWGEHIHLGYYSKAERDAGYVKKNIIKAKYDFIDEMMTFGQITPSEKSVTILDVGCGIGGTSRYLAKKFGENAQVTGITLSPFQVKRATQLAKEQFVSNAEFKVMDALNMNFPDNSFDYVWACESGEHMPDKKKYVEEMTRVLKPGGRIVIATWCQRDEGNNPFDAQDRRMLDFLYSEWSHPYFISINDYKSLMLGTQQLGEVGTDDWTVPTIPSWRHTLWAGVFDPRPVLIRPHLWWKCARDGITLERMHRSFAKGLMQYGMMTAEKKIATAN